ncbi:hypothetical protein MFLAVUS_010446 [Mucor flavus]|uniref:Uncharacterized protein n=1 Tax=Mucor flavus TaxID=439312 RepID=A0ABP9ZCR3_9FUNG
MVEHWLEFVGQNFDSIHLKLNGKRKGKEKEVEKEIVSDDTIPSNKELDISLPEHITDERFELNEVNNVVLLSSQGQKLKDYLPNGFNTDQPSQCLPPAPNRDFMNSYSFNKQLKYLFNTSHLQLIQSTYFGPRGPT